MPPIAIPIDAIADQLLARRIGEDDYAISVEAGEHARLSVGRIMLVARASGRVAWFWTITGPAAPEAGVGLVGEEADLDSAKAALRHAFDRLLYWAAERGSGLRWHGSEGYLAPMAKSKPDAEPLDAELDAAYCALAREARAANGDAAPITPAQIRAELADRRKVGTGRRLQA